MSRDNFPDEDFKALSAVPFEYGKGTTMQRRPPPTHTTIVKLVASRRMIEFATLIKVLILALVLPLALVGAAQVYLCKRTTPGRAFWECLAPAKVLREKSSR